MERKILFQAATVAALVAFVCAVLMGFVVRAPDPTPSLQPTPPMGSISQFVQPTNQYPGLVLVFFAVDSLFVLSYTVVFVGLHAVVVYRGRALAWVGLGAGLLTAVLDATENAFFITYALQAINGVPLTDPALPLIYVVTNLKWMGAFAAFWAFGLVWPRDGWLDWLIVGLMLLFLLVGIVSIALPALVGVRGLFFLVGMPLFAWYFWRLANSK